MNFSFLCTFSFIFSSSPSSQARLSIQLYLRRGCSRPKLQATTWKMSHSVTCFPVTWCELGRYCMCRASYRGFFLTVLNHCLHIKYLTPQKNVKCFSLCGDCVLFCLFLPDCWGNNETQQQLFCSANVLWPFTERDSEWHLLCVMV